MHGELSEDGTIWTIPGAPTKNGRQHVVYLPPLAREIIDAVSRVEGKAGYLFTTTGRSPVSGWSKIKRKAALELWAARVEALVTGPSAKVLAFKGVR